MPGIVISQVDRPVRFGSTEAPPAPEVGAVSTYVNDGVYYQINSTGESQRLDSVNVGTTAPDSPSEGLMWLDTSSNPNIMKVYQNGSWRETYLYDFSTSQVTYDGGSF